MSLSLSRHYRRFLVAGAAAGIGGLTLALAPGAANAQSNPYCYYPNYNPYYCQYYSYNYPYGYDHGYDAYAYDPYAYDPYAYDYGYYPYGVGVGIGTGGGSGHRHGEFRGQRLGGTFAGGGFHGGGFNRGGTVAGGGFSGGGSRHPASQPGFSGGSRSSARIGRLHCSNARPSGRLMRICWSARVDQEPTRRRAVSLPR